MLRYYSIASDKDLNPVLKEKVVKVRSSIFGQCKKSSIPNRFTVIMSNEKPGGTITDSNTGKTTWVPLYALRDVKNVLCNLFG